MDDDFVSTPIASYSVPMIAYGSERYYRTIKALAKACEWVVGQFENEKAPPVSGRAQL